MTTTASPAVPVLPDSLTPRRIAFQVRHLAVVASILAAGVWAAGLALLLMFQIIPSPQEVVVWSVVVAAGWIAAFVWKTQRLWHLRRNACFFLSVTQEHLVLSTPWETFQWS